MASLRLEHISKRFGGTIAVNDLTLDIGEREFLVLLGPSGCGKSTTLRLIAGLEELSAGNIYIGERLVNDLPPKDRAIAVVFPNDALYPHMSVYDNLAFSLKLRHRPAREIGARVRGAVEALGIGQLLRRKPAQLSGGERQRVAFSRALVRASQVVLLDEPPAHLDAPRRAQTCLELLQLHQRLQTTFLYVTHDQGEAMRMGTRIAVLRDGRLQQVAAPPELYAHPANLFVAGFIGSPAMNVFPASLRAEGETLYADTDTCTLPLPRAQRAVVDRYHKRTVILGLRPEHVCAPTRRTDDAGTRVTWPVEVVEHLGSATYAYLRAGRTAVVARLDAHTGAAAGTSLEVVIDPQHLHLFDPDTEQALRA
jgi:multiple sugar transport system ATP-binding protein